MGLGCSGEGTNNLDSYAVLAASPHDLEIELLVGIEEMGIRKLLTEILAGAGDQRIHKLLQYKFRRQLQR
jgi:hypothetical protein